MDPKPTSPSKSLIFMKASVIALGIVFLVLLSALIILKTRKPSQEKDKLVACENTLKTQVSGEVQDMEIHGNTIVVLTKLNPKTKKQEILKFDSHCTQETNRIELNVF